MSSRSYFVQGFGFSVEGIKIEDTLRFIQKYGADLMKVARYNDTYFNTVKELLNAIHNENITENYKITGQFAEVLDELNISEMDDSYWGLDIVADIINEQHDIQIGFERGQEDCIGGPSILIPRLLPWEYSDRLKNANKLEIKRLLEDYARALGLSSDVTDLEIEYYG